MRFHFEMALFIFLGFVVGLAANSFISRCAGDGGKVAMHIIYLCGNE